MEKRKLLRNYALKCHWDYVVLTAKYMARMPRLFNIFQTQGKKENVLILVIRLE